MSTTCESVTDARALECSRDFVKECLRAYQGGELAAWLYGPEPEARLFALLKDYTRAVTCELIGRDAEVNRLRNRVREQIDEYDGMGSSADFLGAGVAEGLRRVLSSS